MFSVLLARRIRSQTPNPSFSWCKSAFRVVCICNGKLEVVRTSPPPRMANPSATLKDNVDPFLLHRYHSVCTVSPPICDEASEVLLFDTRNIHMVGGWAVLTH